MEQSLFNKVPGENENCLLFLLENQRDFLANLASFKVISTCSKIVFFYRDGTFKMKFKVNVISNK